MRVKVSFCIITLFCILTTSSVMAQRINKSFRNVSMSDALVFIDKASEEWELNFIYDDLEDFLVTCDVNNKSVPEAVSAIIGFYPISISIDNNTIYVECTQKEPYKLMGQLVDMQNKPISYANITLFSLNDSTMISSGVSNESGWFTIPCPVRRANVHISHVGFITLNRIMNIGKVGVIRMQDETKQIEPVNVEQQRMEKEMYLSDDFTKYANQIRKKVWGIKLPHFLDTICPNEIKDSSVVFLAKYEEYNILNTDNHNANWAPSLMFGLMGALIFNKYPYITSHLYRLRMLLNDETAVNKWSHIANYKEKMKLTTSKTTVVGIKIIKPNGNEIFPNVDQYTCPNSWNNRIKNRPHDLPINHLQKGDILDIFWFNEGIQIPMKSGEMDMSFSNDNPTLYQQYKYSFAPKYVVRINSFDKAISSYKGIDKHGNHLFSFQGSPYESQFKSHEPRAVLKYWNSHRKARKGMKNILTNTEAQ